ncbi:uncharacterized protein LOC124145262 [Haliotis rufescens]|uniref:uncharacterized protein LOC124145262 n=1 Tax=Haliotis rufescens TaxID=6454 RepID=UPI001EB0A071|nr:uncharacterized protein LOC124145262 [Haliotis rufescens]XP_046370978.1 uncharacterized protein LOC124145262 [Haliotis rufescens]
MKLILVAALLVCLLAIHADGQRHYSPYRIRMYWRTTTSCIYRAARVLSRCPGVRSRFRYRRFNGKREIENADENADQSENDEQLISARDLFETADGGSHGGNSARSTGGIRQPTDA